MTHVERDAKFYRESAELQRRMNTWTDAQLLAALEEHVFPIGHKITLRDYRKPVKERHSKHTGPYTWRVNDPSSRPDGIGFYTASHAPLRMDAHGSALDLRIQGANDVEGFSHNVVGYYTDEHGDSDTLQPIVALLPHSRGFLAGWTMGAGMCATLSRTIHATAIDAARAAHEEAQIDAEKERELAEEQEHLDNGGGYRDASHANTATAPSAWASYLINRDASGISDEDKQEADAFIAFIGMGAPVSCEDAGFLTHCDARSWGCTRFAADCQTYIFLGTS